jgi:hypothetical protein
MVRLSSYTSVEETLAEMGLGRGKKWYPINANSGVSQPAGQRNRLYISSNYVSHFTAGMKLQVTNNSAYPPNNNDDPYTTESVTVSSVAATYIVLTADLAYDYAVATFAVVWPASPYTEVTNPKWSEVDKKLRNIEDMIDSMTHHTWKARAYREYYDFYTLYRRYVHPLRLASTTRTIDEVIGSVYLQHKPVTALSVTADTAYTGYLGDSIIVWRNNAWTEIFNAGNPYSATNVDIWTFGRDKDYWIDYPDGILTFVSKTPDVAVRAIYIAYRVADTIRAASNAAGQGAIEEAAKMFLKASLLQDRRFIVDFPGASDAMETTRAIAEYNMQAKNLLRRYVELESNNGW